MLRDALVTHAKAVVVTCAPRWRQVDVGDFMGVAASLVNSALKEGIAVAERSTAIPKPLLDKHGFGPLSRYKHLVVCLHSIGGVVGCSGVPIKQASGTVFLASGLSRAVGVSASMREFPVPVLSVFGEYDGQHHLAKVAIDIANSGVLFHDDDMDDVEAARTSFAMVERCNHAMFSRPENINTRRGDLPLDGVEGVDHGAAMARVASLVAAFSRANGLDGPGDGTDDKSVTRDAAALLLRTETRRARALLVPFLTALGRASAQPTDNMILKYATGAEMVPANAPPGSFVPRHPGELLAGEQFALRAQEYVMGGRHASVVVTATVHTVYANFLRSKVYQRVDASTGRTVVDVQCFLFSAKGCEYSHVSPIYALKLKSLLGLGLSTGRKAASESTPTPADLFDLSMRRAEELCPEELLARFRARGKPLKVVERFHCVPPLWAKSQSKMNGSSTLVLNAFDVSKACGGRGEREPEREQSPLSMHGLLYVHVPSEAFCLEHIMVGAFKRAG